MAHEVPLDKIPYVDFPELRLNAHESTEMPFRYVEDKDGKPVMPEVGSSGPETDIPRMLTGSLTRE